MGVKVDKFREKENQKGIEIREKRERENEKIWRRGEIGKTEGEDTIIIRGEKLKRKKLGRKRESTNREKGKKRVVSPSYKKKIVKHFMIQQFYLSKSDTNFCHENISCLKIGFNSLKQKLLKRDWKRTSDVIQK